MSKITNRLYAFCLAVSVCFGISPMAYATLTDEGAGAGSQNIAGAVNDAGVVVGNALNSANQRVGYVALTTGTEVTLSTLGDACAAGGINNNGSTSQIVGSCRDANGVWQAVVWTANTPAVAPKVLAPFPGLLGLGAGVITSATAQNNQGAIVGGSSDSVGTSLPAFWTSGSSSPTLLAVGILGLNATNCAPVDISDPIVSNGNKAAIVGNCPNNGTGTGQSLPVIWANSGAGAAALPVPSGAQYCSAGEVNVNGYVLGECVYATDVYKTVRWTYPWTAVPTVLQTLSGSAASRNSSVDMNASGQISGNYKAASGFTLPFFWDPTSTGTSGVAIAALSGGSTASAVVIGNNGEIVINAETANGDTHAVKSLMGAALIDEGTLSGGSNSAFTAISPNGTKGVGGSEVSAHVMHSMIDPSL